LVARYHTLKGVLDRPYVFCGFGHIKGVPRIPQLLVLETLGKEGEVMLWRPKPSDPYRVLFRLDGRKFNRSTGETNYAAAQRKGAEIFAEVVRGQKEA